MSVCVYEYKCVCVYVFVCARASVCLRLCIFLYLFLYLCMSVCAYVAHAILFPSVLCVSMCLFPELCMCIPSCVYLYACMCFMCLHVCTWVRVRARCLCRGVHVCLNKQMYARVVLFIGFCMFVARAKLTRTHTIFHSHSRTDATHTHIARESGAFHIDTYTSTESKWHTTTQLLRTRHTYLLAYTNIDTHPNIARA